MVLAILLFIAGGIGNLIDRMMHNGTVVDFINVGIGPLRTGIFNIADITIMGGAALLLFTTFRKQKKNG
jgi:signal peptidase II